MLEGYPDSLTLVLWEQTDYIIYFPENQWILEHLEEYGRPVDRWEPAVNPDITLRVVHMGPDGQAAAEEYLSILFPGYQWEIWKDNRLEGTDMQHFRIFRARLVQGQENYALVAEYPFVAVEGFGSHLEPVLDSIQLLP